MKRWKASWYSGGKYVPGEYVESTKVDAFIADLIAVYEKHGLAIGHEDGHGAFLVTNDGDGMRDWLQNAHIDEGVEWR